MGRVLTGAELAAFLSDKRNKGSDIAYTSAGGDAFSKIQRGDKGLLGNIGRGLTQPLDNLFNFGAELGSNVGSGGRSGGVLTTQQKENLPEFLARTGAGLASYAVPVGGAATLGGTVARGALAGGLGTYGAQEVGDYDFGDIAKGAGVGGAFAGALRLLGNAKAKQIKTDKAGKQAITQQADDLLDDVTKPQPFDLTTIDDQIAQNQRGFLGKKLTPQQANAKLGTTNIANARLNQIDQTLGKNLSNLDDAVLYRDAISAVVDDMPLDDPLRKAITRRLASANDKVVQLQNKTAQKVGTGLADDVADDVAGAADDVSKMDQFKDYLVSDNRLTDAEGFAKTRGNVVSKTGKQVRYDTLGIKAQPDDFNYYTNSKQLQADVDELLTAIGEKPTQKGIQKLKDNLIKARNDFIKTAERSGEFRGVGVDDFASKLVKDARITGMSGKMTNGDAANIFKDLAADVLNATDDQQALSNFIAGKSTLSPTLMQKIRQNIGAKARNAFKRIDKGTARDMDYIINAIDEQLKGTLAENIPGYIKANSLMAQLGEQGKSMSAAFNAGNNVSNLGQQNILSDVTRYAKSRLVGPTIQNVGEGLPGVRNAVGNIVNKGVQGAARITPAPLLGPLAVNTAARAPGLLMGGQSEPINMPDATPPETMSFEEWKQVNVDPEFELRKEKQNAIRELLAAGATMNQINDLMATLYPEQGQGQAKQKTTQAQQKFANAASAAQQALTMLESGQASTGKLQQVKSGVERFFGTAPEGQTEYQAKLALARGMAVNAFAGSNVSASEAKRIADAIPTLSDEPKVARQKLRTFMQLLAEFGSANIGQQEETPSYNEQNALLSPTI